MEKGGNREREKKKKEKQKKQKEGAKREKEGAKREKERQSDRHTHTGRQIDEHTKRDRGYRVSSNTGRSQTDTNNAYSSRLKNKNFCFLSKQDLCSYCNMK